MLHRLGAQFNLQDKGFEMRKRALFLLAPAAAGKTTYVLNHVRDAAQGLRATPRVVVASHLQVRAWRRRLAEAGGTIGVRVLDHKGHERGTLPHGPPM